LGAGFALGSTFFVSVFGLVAAFLAGAGFDAPPLISNVALLTFFFGSVSN
jgi:hypothetical protein